MTPAEAYAELERRFARLSDVGRACAILNWDRSAMMPSGAAADRADQLATLGVIAHGMIAAPDMPELLGRAEEGWERLPEWQALRPGDYATWTGAGIGKDQITLNRWSLAAGGHCRTGLEDNVRWDKDTLAPSNAALVKRVADLCAEYGRHPASVQEARALLKLAA
ncbi:MAG: 3-keto-5-aminohexanoate cleavage protein [Proteobacteria bacterium]|nr:3-keto-5-aminohexanoate cleavage protein [Pseudomonadota bacterium]